MTEEAATHTTRRRALLLGGLGTVGAAAAGSVHLSRQVEPQGHLPPPIPFHGDRQAGVAETPQAFASWSAFDLAKGADRDAIRRLMRVWTDDIARLMNGRLPVTDVSDELANPSARLTATIGFGPGLFAAADLDDQRPAWLQPLPALGGDKLHEEWNGGDLVVQLCSEDHTQLTHARHQLVLNAGGLVTPRWTQTGFRQHSTGGGPMRNLFGQVDGMVNPDLTDDAGLIWHGKSAAPWLRGGTSMVIRRIRMDLDAWAAVDRPARERAVGRRLSDGRPLAVTRGDQPDLSATDDLGLEAIDLDSHMRLAMPRRPTERILRRPYSYDDPGAGEAGLVFIAFQRDVHRQFLPIQQRLASSDLLNIWVTTVGSAVFAVPGGCRPGEYIGERLLG